METTTVVNIVDTAISSAALVGLDNKLTTCVEYLGSIRILLIIFFVWLVICAVHKFLNMFF